MRATELIVRRIDNGWRPGYPIWECMFEVSLGQRRGRIAIGITDKSLMHARRLPLEERLRAAEQWLLKLQGEGEDIFMGEEELYRINLLDSAFHYFAKNGEFE